MNIQLYKAELKKQDQMYQIMKSNFGEEHQSCAFIKINKGEILLNLHNPMEAQSLVQSGIESIRKREKTAKVLLPRALTILSRIYLQKGNYNEANAVCQQALLLFRTMNEVQKKPNEEIVANQANKQFAIVLMNVAQAFQSVSRFQESIQIQEEGLQLIQDYIKQLQVKQFVQLSEQGKNSDSRATGKQELVSADGVEESKGSMIKSNNQEKEQEEEQEPKSELQMSQQYLCVALNNLGSSLLLEKEYEKSQKYLERALKLNEQISNEKNADYARILQNLSSLYIETEEPQLSMLHSSEALEIYEQILPKKDRQLAVAYLNHSQILLKLKRFDFAQTFIEQAISILSENKETEFSFENVLAHQYLSDVFQGEQDPESALFCLEKRLDLIKKMEQAEPEDLYRATYDLAVFQFDQKMDKCIETLFSAIQPAQMKSVTLPMAIEYMFVAAQWMKRGKSESEKEFMQKMEDILNLQSEALNLIQINDPNEELKICEKEMVISQTLNQMKRYEGVEEVCLRNLKTLDKYDNSSKNNNNLALGIQCEVLKELSFALDQVNQQEDSLNFLREYIKNARKLYQTNNDISIAFNTLIIKLEEAGNQENLIKGLQEQYQYYIELIGDPPLHYNAISTLSSLATLYEALGQKTEANQYQAQAAQLDQLLLRTMTLDQELEAEGLPMNLLREEENEKFDF